MSRTHRGHVLQFEPNRVWRTYPGGKVLDSMAGCPTPADSHFPEDWIGSVTRAINPGREKIVEGIATAKWEGGSALFSDLLSTDPIYLLGKDHFGSFGPRPQVLVKFLDSAVRLHLQCHPSASFAQSFMNEPSGKAEAYHILAIRPEVENPYIYLGFQHPPSKEKLRSLIERQDVAGMEALFDKIPVKPGDTIYIPGGFPHAIGEGILMIEIMEPSDLAVRFEFEKAGYTLPESARFMGRSLDFCLDVFDFNKTTPDTLKERYFFKPEFYRDLGPNSSQFSLIDESTTACFKLRMCSVCHPIVKTESEFYFLIVLEGEIEISTEGGTKILSTMERAFVPHGLKSICVRPIDQCSRWLEVYPPGSSSNYAQ